MSLTILEAFDPFFTHLKFDKELANRIYRFQVGYINKSREHLEFFGGNLIGTHKIHFKDSDVARFFNDVIDVDMFEITAVVPSITAIDMSRKVSSDTLNLVLMYLMHRVATSPKLSNINDKKDCMRNLALIFFYRCFAAIHSDYFKYPTDPQTAQMAYSTLSQKFLIKSLGNWSSVMLYRANELIDNNSIHYRTFLRFDDDIAIIYLINDSQGRIRDIIKNYCAAFYSTHEEGSNIKVTSSTMVDLEGEEVLKEKTKSTEAFINYLRGIIIDTSSFINRDLIGLISKINTNTSSRMIRITLEWLSTSYNEGKFHKEIDEFVELIIIHSLHLIEYNIPLSRRRDYGHLLIELKNLYLSTRSTDQELLRIRELGQKLILASLPKGQSVTDSLMFSTRTAIILYITLRVLIGKNN